MKRKTNYLLLCCLTILAVTASIVLPFSTLTAQGATQTVFSDVTAAAGVPTVIGNWTWAWGDYNDDGYLDLYLANHPRLNDEGSSSQSTLLQNDRDGTFTDRILTSGIMLGEDRHDSAFVDFDNDGDLDLWIALGGRGGTGIEVPKQLYQQNASHTFTDVAVAAGVDYPLGRGRGTAWLDYDLDGDLDMVFTGALSDVAPNAFFENNGDGTFTNVTTEVGLEAFAGAQSQASVADYDNDGDPDLFITGTNWRLYRNDNGYFTPVQEEAGVHAAHSQGADWADFDNDGDLDLYVTVGSQDGSGDYWEMSGETIRFLGNATNGDEDGLDFTASGSLTFDIQEQDGGVTRRATNLIYLGAAGTNPASNPFTVSDGDLVGAAPVYTPGVSIGYFIWQDAPGSWHIRWTGMDANNDLFSGTITPSSSTGTVSTVNWEETQYYALPNQLFQNNGDGTFTEIGEAAGVAYSGDSRGVDWGDYDNDGDMDLFVGTNGPNGDNPPDLLYRNNGDGTFTDVAASARVSGMDIGGTWGGTFADYDNDGFLDLLSGTISISWPLDMGGYQLFHNDGNTNHWIELDVTSELTNTQGYGTKIWVTANGETQFQEVDDSSHYFNHYAGPVHFGLGTATEVEHLVIEWPDGQQVTYNNVPVDKIIETSQLDGINWEAEPTTLSVFIPFIRR